jgi:hypothetical protein
MSARSEWEIRQASRLRKLLALESESARVHEKLIELWKSGKHDSSLLEEDREAHMKLAQARREYELGLKAKPWSKEDT